MSTSTSRDLEAAAWGRPPNLDVFTPKDRYAQLEYVLEGTNCSLRLEDGRIYVGRVLFVRLDVVTIRLWGAGEMTFPRDSVAMVSVVSRHRWRDGQEVRRRQSRGEPALMVAPMKKATRK